MTMTDSNIQLLKQSSAIDGVVNDIVTAHNHELLSLQMENREVSCKTYAESQMDNMNHGRKCNSDSVEPNNRSPEDVNQLQRERDNLTKMLISVQENLQQVKEELGLLKSVKNEELKKTLDHLNDLKKRNITLAREMKELKDTVSQKVDEIKAMQAELKSKEAQLAVATNKEIQIRRIAKKYKDSYFELKREITTTDMSLEEQASAGSVAGLAEVNRVQVQKLDTLSAQLVAYEKQIDQLKQENKSEDEDKKCLIEAINKIATITEETNRKINSENKSMKAEPQTCDSYGLESEDRYDEMLVWNLESRNQQQVSVQHRVPSRRSHSRCHPYHK